MTRRDLLRHARLARAEARRLLAEGHLGLAGVRSRDAAALERLAEAEPGAAATASRPWSDATRPNRS